MTHYELGASTRFPALKGAIAWKRLDAIGGVKAWARNESTGEYVRVFEVGATEWVDGQPQAWSSGNFESVEDAQKFASKAYRYLNKRKGA